MQTRSPGGLASATVPLVLLPGIVCDRAAWDPVIPALSRFAPCQVHETGPDRTLGAMAERVLAAAPPAFALAGHSMGGRVALEIVRRAPRRVQRLALLDTGWRTFPGGIAGEEERAGRYALLALARRDGMRAMGRAWVRRMVHPERLEDATLIDAILDMIERHTPDRFEVQIEALLARPDAGSVLRSIDCATLVLCGRQDAWSPLAQHEEMAATIPGAMFEVIDDCGHMAPMEAPERVADAMSRWLQAPSESFEERRWAS
jgi:pimeloyl-ACP methyl ester carboxylesterase